MRTKFKAAFVSLFLIASSAQARDVEMAWEKAMVYTPTDSSLTKMSELELNGSHPSKAVRTRFHRPTSIVSKRLLM